MSLHLVSLLVDGDQPDIRDLGDRLRAWLERERSSGSGVKLVRGPSILAGQAVDALEDE